MKVSHLLCLATALSLSMGSNFVAFADCDGNADKSSCCEGKSTDAAQKGSNSAPSADETGAQAAAPTQADASASSTAAQDSKKGRPRIGLALGGGGARGAAHVGVLKVLQEEGIPIDLIAGTSIGSVVGGLYASGMNIDDLATKFEDAELMKQFMTVPISVRVLVAPIMVMPRFFGYHPYDGLYNGVKFRNYANKLAGTHNTIEKLKIPFAAVVTSVVDGESCRITEGDLGTAMQASTAVPGVRKPVQIGQKLFCDGGLICNVPVNHVRDMGADFVIAVDIDEPLKPVPLDNFRKMGSMSKQALRIQLNYQDVDQGKDADIVIHPDTEGIGLLSRNKGDAKRGYEAGIKAARAAMPELKRKLTEKGILCAK